MAESDKSGQSPERAVWAIVYPLLGPILWLIHFTVVYALQSTLCVVASPIHLVLIATLIVTVLALIALAAALGRAGKNDRQSSRPFLRQTMRLLALLSAVSIIWTCLAALFLHPCAPLR
jgi:hypothetical protein